MAGAVDMKPVAVFVVVILGTAVAGIIGAIFAIPTAAAILAVTDYLRKRDVLLRAEDETRAGPIRPASRDRATPRHRRPTAPIQAGDCRSAVLERRRREQVAELLAPDDGAREVVRVRRPPAGRSRTTRPSP